MTDNKPMTCEELEACLADMLDGELEPARMEAFAAHIETCEACRREWQAWRDQESQLQRYYALERERMTAETADPSFLAPAPVVEVRRSAPWLRPLAWAAAALAFITIGAAGYLAWLRTVPAGSRVLAKVRLAEGPVQLLEAGTYRPLAVGAELAQDQRVKVGESGYAALEYPDGNILEVRGGTQLALREFRDRTEVAMNRGQVWAHLKHKPAKRYEIVTGQLRAIATGTVYSVQEGLGQTLVAVAEGTVRVEGTGLAQTAVSAGSVYSSRPESAAGPVNDLIDWSRYRQDLASLEKLAGPRQEAAAPPLASEPTAAAPAPAPAPATAAPAAAAQGELNDLLDALPDGIRAFVDIHDWGNLTGQFRGSVYAALSNEPALRKWWGAVGGEKLMKDFNDEVRLMEWIEMVKSLDGQVVLALTPKGEFILLADCRAKEQQMRAKIEGLFKAAEEEAASHGPSPSELARLREHVTVAGGRIILTSAPAVAREALGRLTRGEASNFKKSSFYKKVKADVRETLFLAGVDMNGIWPAEGRDKDFDAAMTLMGLRGLDTLVLSPGFVGRGMNQAARLGFAGNRYGVMNWLAEPGPMRGYDFFSNEVHFFASARIRNLRQLFFDYLNYQAARYGEKGRTVAREFFNAHEALFDSFGGELAIGIENPLLPIPNVKIAIELADRATFEHDLTLFLKALIQNFEQHGRMAYVESRDYRGRKIYSFVMSGIPILPSWAYVDDFLVLGPGPEFVQHSIDVYSDGSSIGHDNHLTGLFPSGAGANFSLLVYQDIVKALPGLLQNKVMPFFGEAGKVIPNVSFLERFRAPGIAYACAWPRNIDLYLNTPDGIDLNMGMAVPLVANWLAPRLNIDAAADIYAETMVRLNTLKAAVLKFKAANGRWPGNLGELANPAGKYIDEVPRDPFGNAAGEMLKLVPAPDGTGVILYSLGPDGVDQQGAAELKPDQNLDDPGDIVLRVP